MTKAQFGMIGLGTMGRNFLLNVAEHGFACAGYDLDAVKRQLLLDEGKGFEIGTGNDLSEFVGKLAVPRSIMLLVPAGPIVDSVINDLLPHLEKGDLIIDGGNSHFTDTERREAVLNEKGIEFLGVGVSGGEEGARHGASIMIGGKPEVYDLVRPVFEAASAKVNGEPCAAHVGKGSAGHFVKMVHNGIEYGLMQLIAESYDLLKRGYGKSDTEISDIFDEWNRGELDSFLIETTAIVLKKQDKTGNPLVEMILDTAGQKGTGKWTSQAAMDYGVPIPTIDTAVTMRQISSFKPARVALAAKYPKLTEQKGAQELSIDELRNSLHLAFIVTYAQGLSLLRAASAEKRYELDMVEIAKIWRGGCIIRAALLEQIRQVFAAEPTLNNLLASDVFSAAIASQHAALKAAVIYAVAADIPCMSITTSLNYLTAFATDRLPANLIQAQRDYFGAHTYQRIDEEGTFHTPDWNARMTDHEEHV
jgi:6-phosphogluconate dehydrogenase